MTGAIIIYEDDGWYVAEDILSGVASQGRTISEASSNLREALELYYEDDESRTTKKRGCFPLQWK